VLIVRLKAARFHGTTGGTDKWRLYRGYSSGDERIDLAIRRASAAVGLRSGSERFTWVHFRTITNNFPSEV
jgi:hypothetical protein